MRKFFVHLALLTSCASSGETSPTPNMRAAASVSHTRLATRDAAPSTEFIWAEVRSEAEALSRTAFEDSAATLPESLRNLTYDQYRDIRFVPERALWRAQGLPFRAHFFHRGFLFDRQVETFEVVGKKSTPVAFERDLFDYGRNGPSAPEDPHIGFAGVRLHYPLNRPDYFDELAVFQGASYYRFLGRGQVYGASARGLAVDTASARAEEFPYFRRFWLVRPDPGAERVTVLALLDGPSVTGAYRFAISPGAPTSIDVDAALFFRRSVEKLGIAPLTSMFLFGEDSRGSFDDYRPEVHDSDGLLLETGTGEWIWRPVTNPERVRVSAFAIEGPRGFGLMQRDRGFDHYQDLEAHYERRPSLWVAPHGSWGRGHVELLELPITRETDDNVSVYWVPDERPRPGQRLDLAYRVEASLDEGVESPNGRVVATRTTAATRHAAQVERDPNERRFLVDFAGKRLAALAPTAQVKVSVTATHGRAEYVAVEKNPVDGTWRAHFTVRAESSEPVELRAFLKRDDDVLTETWSYQWTPLKMATAAR